MSASPIAPRALRVLLIAGAGAPGKPPADRSDTAAIQYAMNALEIALLKRCKVQKEQLIFLDAPSVRQVESELRQVAETARSQNETLLIFYIGHGQVNYKGELYLLTDSAAHGALEQNGLPFQKMSRILERTAPSATAIFLDCCYSGRSRRSRQRLRYEPFSDLLPYVWVSWVLVL